MKTSIVVVNVQGGLHPCWVSRPLAFDAYLKHHAHVLAMGAVVLKPVQQAHTVLGVLHR
jgi:hypothetical protein